MDYYDGPKKRPEIIILCGIPTSGKSTWAEKKVHDSMHTNNPYVILSRDEVRLRPHLFKQPYNFSSKTNEQIVTELLKAELSFHMEGGHNIIIDNTHVKEHYINNILLKNADYIKYDYYIKFFDLPLWKAYWRNYWRNKRTGKHIPHKVLKDMHKSYKKLNKNQFKHMNYD